MDDGLIIRRLLLAKEFYLQAKENSKKIDAVSKMMAIHNYHIGVEITLKAIILQYNIRTERQLNIDFESMMSEIANKISKPFPFRQELRSLNSLRGLVQHQGIEPDLTSLEDFEVITRRFLSSVFEKYFDVDFFNLSRVALISDEIVIKLLSKAYETANTDTLKAYIILEGTLQFLRPSVSKLLPSESFNSSFFVTSKLNIDKYTYGSELSSFYEPIKDGFESIFERIREVESYTAMLASGVNITDLKRFQSQPFRLKFSIAGNPIVDIRKDHQIDLEEFIWAFNFMVSTILLWQKSGLEPKIFENFFNAVDMLLDFDTGE